MLFVLLALLLQPAPPVVTFGGAAPVVTWEAPAGATSACVWRQSPTGQRPHLLGCVDADVGTMDAPSVLPTDAVRVDFFGDGGLVAAVDVVRRFLTALPLVIS